MAEVLAGPLVIGVNASDTFAFHGGTPVSQYAFAASTGTLSGIGAAPLSASGLSGFGFSTSAQLLALVAEVRDIRALLNARALGA